MYWPLIQQIYQDRAKYQAEEGQYFNSITLITQQYQANLAIGAENAQSLTAGVPQADAQDGDSGNSAESKKSIDEGDTVQKSDELEVTNDSEVKANQTISDESNINADSSSEEIIIIDPYIVNRYKKTKVGIFEKYMRAFEFFSGKTCEKDYRRYRKFALQNPIDK